MEATPNRTFLCMEATLLPKRTSERQEIPLARVFECLELVLYGIRELCSITLEIFHYLLCRDL